MLHHYFIHKPLHPFTACCTYSSLHKSILHSLLLFRRQYHYCPCTCHSLLQRVDDINLGNRSQHAPSCLPRQPLSLFLHFRFFTFRHFATLHKNRHSFKRRPLTDITNPQHDHHPQVNPHQHAFSSRHRRSHHGAVRPPHFDSLSCLCCSHFSCSSSGILVLLDGDH